MVRSHFRPNQGHIIRTGGYCRQRLESATGKALERHAPGRLICFAQARFLLFWWDRSSPTLSATRMTGAFLVRSPVLARGPSAEALPAFPCLFRLSVQSTPTYVGTLWSGVAPDVLLQMGRNHVDMYATKSSKQNQLSPILL